ncbi:YecA family protein [Clostridium sp.]|uniref:YecA family protein n=1 Tax=Clostridium sp. TaxID=1506 RepID=UPI00257D8A02|nr:SEC-C domain-containing protein [Clostridium sp.]MBS4842898.1 SEC-C domain-containing protein [Clostridium sp.]MDU1403984.1 SEC-C domain-containing protein [Clostridium sp.]MDU4927762.1 SEC-C domain-containing protein [Clostridium sp.]
MEGKETIKLLNDYLKNKDESKVAECLLELYIDKQDKFQKTIFIGGVLPDPFSYDYNQKKYLVEYFEKGCSIAINQLIKDEETKWKFTKQVRTILDTYKVIGHHNTSNEERCDKCEFLKYDKARQLQMICVFIEDQMRLANENNNEKIQRKGLYTGLESTTPLEVNGNERYQLSSSDAMEGNLEIANELFKFIFYINRTKMKDCVDSTVVNPYPYELPSFEEIMYITSHRVMIKRAWDLIKYRNWNIKLHKYNNEEFYRVEPKDLKAFKIEGASIKRTEYDEFQKSMNMVSLWKIFNENLKIVLEKIQSIELEDVFDIDCEYVKVLMKFYESIIQSNLQFTYKFYGKSLLDVEIADGINFKLFFDTINYLYSIANIYVWKSYDSVNVDKKEDYYKFAPIIDVEKLVRKLSETLNLEKTVASKCIDLFIFKPQTKKSKIALDIFSQPLVFVSDTQIVFSPSFVLQMNVKRIVDKILGAINYNFSDKGYNMEDLINNLLEQSKYLKVNKNNIKFQAYDGKEVEFDSLSVFNNKLIVMEIKCRNAPYSPKERNDKSEILIEAVNQVKRRVKVIQHDWSEIKKRSSIDLMDNPPAEEDIIKIACFNFFDFTGQVIDNVYITDYSAVTKYFNKSVDYAKVLNKNSIEKIPVNNIWKDDSPTILNFLKYLEMPSMLKEFYENIKFNYRYVIRIEEDDQNLCIMDYYLEENPYNKYFNLALQDKEKKPNTNYKAYMRKRKIGRNQLCPCGSGKKYKKCCGVSN